MDRARLAKAIQAAAFTALAFDCFFPYITQNLPSPGFIIPVVVWLAAAAELYGPTVRPGVIAAWLSIPFLGGIASYALSNLPDVVLEPLGTLPATLNQYFFVIPLAIAAGALVGRSDRIGVLATALRAFAFLSAALALFERVTGHLVFAGNVVATNFGTNGEVLSAALTGSGAVRGIVGAYHPLVLGTLLVAVLPLAFARPSRRTVVEVLVLLVGIWATDSLGPLAIAGVITAIRVVALVRRRSPKTQRVGVVMLGYALAIAVFAAFATWVWTPVVDADAASDASTQYRFALFSVIPRLLAGHPWGLGLGQLPAGTILLESSGHPIDITGSVDSELVVLVLQIGVIGAVAFIAALGLALRNVAARSQVELGSWSLVALTGSGLFLALHVWPAVAGLWALLIGIGLSSLRSRSIEVGPAPAAELATAGAPLVRQR